ncbi:MAG: Vps62-related protein, partial [Chloroflexi bacterium]|nr:Vps62-related protein [Chloroflexota bacterium]
MCLTRRDFVTRAALSASLPGLFGRQARAATATAGATPLSPAIVQSFAPIIHFHPDEPYLPCTIEHILKNGALKDVSPKMIEGQSTSRPAICALGDTLWMVYTDSRSSQLYVTYSPDGLVWPQVQQIPGQHTSVPAIAAAWGKLWMAYTDANNSQIWVTSSKNGWDWE